MQTTWKKRILQILLLLSLTAFACWFALKDDCAEVLYNISHIPWYWMLGIAALGTAYYLLQGIVLYRIAKPYKADIRIWDGIHNAYIAAFSMALHHWAAGRWHRPMHFASWICSTVISPAYYGRIFPLPKYRSVLCDHFAAYTLFLCTGAFSALLFLVLLGFAINASVIVILWTMARFPRLYVKISRGIVNIGFRFHIVKNKAYTLEKWQGQILYFNEEIKKLKKERRMIVEAVLLNFYV